MIVDMDARYAISLVLNAHLPYVKTGNDWQEPSLTEETSTNADGSPFVNLAPGSLEESWFFEALSETYLPLLSLFDRLEADHIPFRLGMAVSPVLVQLLSDDLLLKKYAAYLDRQINFGEQELERLKGNSAFRFLAQRYFDQAIDRRAAIATRYEGNIFKALQHYQRKRNIEFLAVPATHAFLPFLCPFPEAVQAQIETSLSFYRYSLGLNLQGFWLPELGWSPELDPFLRAYGFNYTITDSHGLVLGNPPPLQGSFFPVRTPQGILVLARDFYACSDIAGMYTNEAYLNTGRDIGYELPHDSVSLFQAQNGARCQTGYKYWPRGNGDAAYNPELARTTAEEHARTFLERCCARLDSASRLMQEIPLSLCAFNADSFGRSWREGARFLESLFRLAAGYRELRFITPSDYLCQQPISRCQVSLPEFSSWGTGGYTEVWLDSSNDWMYRHLNRALDRMAELADRFSKNSGLKERALNQAAREILIACSSDWPAFLSRQECTEYARYQVEDALRNFTTIYEALGSNYISTEWLTSLERRHDIFPNINYRVFKRKQ